MENQILAIRVRPFEEDSSGHTESKKETFLAILGVSMQDAA